MITLAYLGRQLKGQLSGNPEGLEGVEISWQGASVEQLLKLDRDRPLSVLVAELEELGDAPVETLAKLHQALDPELTLVLHHFARREDVQVLAGPATRTLQAPVSLAALRAQMLSLIVRDMLTPSNVADARSARKPSTSKVCPKCGARLAV